MAVQEHLDLITVPDAPDIDGLVFRRFRGEEDYPHMARVINASNRVDGEERVESAETISVGYSHLTNCDPYQDMIFAEINGEVIGYGRCTWWQEENGPRIYVGFGWVTPEWQRKGIGGAMYRYQENHLREIAKDHPADVEKFFEAWAADVAEGRHALFTSAGFEPITYGARMVRPNLDNIPEASLPEGLTVYPVEEHHLRRIWEADQEAFRDHFGYSPPVDPDDAFQEWLEFPHRDESLWQIAWDGHPDEGGEVAGQVKSYIHYEENEEFNRRLGWTEFISVRRPYRRQGLATALIARSLKVLKARGMEMAALGVHTENPNGAFDLYKKMGYEVVRQWTTYRKAFE